MRKDFPYTVIIPQSRLVEKNRLVWCHEHIGKYTEKWKTGGNEGGGIVYYFKDEADAVMFKLKFGGY